jgi:high-affinity Fe2+/Pb2+ permease
MAEKAPNGLTDPSDHCGLAWAAMIVGALSGAIMGALLTWVAMR